MPSDLPRIDTISRVLYLCCLLIEDWALGDLGGKMKKWLCGTNLFAFEFPRPYVYVFSTLVPLSTVFFIFQ